MRKSLLMAAAAASAMLVMAPAAAALAAPAPHHVLTIRRVGGPNVAVRAVLQAGLKPRTTATFIQPGTTNSVKCARSTFRTKVTANPVRPGTAVLSLTAQTFAGCTISIRGVRVLSLTVKVPDRTTISDARGFPVTVFAPSATIKAALGTSIFTCSYRARKIIGHASNVGSLISFSRQIFNRSGGPPVACPARAAFAATYGPVVDLSVLGHPHVFVN